MAKSKLKPVSRVTLSDQVAAQIAAQISEEFWRPGDKLPGESELCATMRIGRSTLREALKSLAYVGIVQMRPGEGTYVTENAHSLAHRIHARGILKSDKELQDVSEARLILETELAAMAAERLQPDDLKRLEEILGEMKICLEEGGQDYAVLDVDFHLAIAKSSKNQLMYELLAQIRHVLQDFIATSQELPGMKDSAHEHHARILAALRQRNPEKARREMRTHLQICEKAFSLLEKISEATPVSRTKRRA
ncbi:MAG TPA: FadR/GntR family transcriptional regulator [Bryobacteraceae bacterium]|jgi:GntR family transcriptional repressor for pyruvate dehydrogenase complex|nr:FadR/GntR family transcriptional regulator [Bryobacteraceae bacterium]